MHAPQSRVFVKIPKFVCIIKHTRYNGNKMSLNISVSSQGRTYKTSLKNGSKPNTGSVGTIIFLFMKIRTSYTCIVSY